LSIKLNQIGGTKLNQKIKLRIKLKTIISTTTCPNWKLPHGTMVT